MNRALVKSLIRSLTNNGGRTNCSRNIFSAATVVRQAGIAQQCRHPGGVPTSSIGVLYGRRMTSISGAKQDAEEALVEKDDKKKEAGLTPSTYWGIPRRKIMRKDGSEWPWNCFMPWETYRADVSIDVKKHYAPKTFIDRVAFRTVKLLRIPSDMFFQKRYGCHAMMLETVAAVPGMVGGMLLHLRSLRKFEQSGGWIKALLEEAENERMHLMTMIELVQPKWIVGYLEEEAIHSYTQYLNAIDSGEIDNVPAPAIAIDYWRLPKDATLRDVIIVIRADEAHHRDVNHFASDIHYQGKQLKEAPAPLGYH